MLRELIREGTVSVGEIKQLEREKRRLSHRGSGVHGYLSGVDGMIHFMM